jgi:hypothetical protein
MGEEEFLDILRQAHERSRHYADYWEWGVDRKRAERGVAEALIEHLGVEGSFDPNPLETPDLVFLTSDGRKIGIEVAEIVNGRAAAINRHAEKKGQSRVWAIWDDATLAKALSHWVTIKDDKIGANSDQFDEVWLVLATDEPTIDMTMAERACATCEVSAKHLRSAFVLLGYHPDALSRFPSGCAAFSIALA